MRTALLGLVTLCAGCALAPEKLFGSYAKIEVREVGRSLYCNTDGSDPQAQLLPDLKALRDWQAARNVHFAGDETLAPAAYALVEMGSRPTGGYGLAVARSAVLRGELVILSATFVTPAPGSLRTQAVSSPCVLVQLPPGRYDQVEVDDQTGAMRAAGGVGPVTAPKAPAPETPVPETPPPPQEGYGT